MGIWKIHWEQLLMNSDTVNSLACSFYIVTQSCLQPWSKVRLYWIFFSLSSYLNTYCQLSTSLCLQAHLCHFHFYFTVTNCSPLLLNVYVCVCAHACTYVHTQIYTCSSLDIMTVLFSTTLNIFIWYVISILW